VNCKISPSLIRFLLSSTLSCLLLCYHSVYLTICLSYLFFIPNFLIIQCDVGQDRKAELDLEPTLYFYPSIDKKEEGILIRDEKMRDNAHSVNLTHLQSMDLSLMDYSDNQWEEKNKTFYSVRDKKLEK